MKVFKKIIGYLILIAFFALLFMVTVNKNGLIEALILWGVTILVAGLVGLAIYLINDWI